MILEGTAAAAAALLHAGPRASAILARIGGAAGAAARVEAARLGALDRGARVRALAARVAELRAPVPVGLPLVHRDWIDVALAGEGARVRDILVGGAEVAAPVRVWLERRVYGGIVAIPLPAPGAPVTPATIAHRSAEAIESMLRRAGVLTVALALAGVDPPPGPLGPPGPPGPPGDDGGAPRNVSRPAVAAVAAMLGADGAALVGAVAEMLAAAGRSPAGLGTRRAAARRMAGISLADDPVALIAIGARTLGPHTAGAPARQIAQRLPRSLGLRVLAEMEAFASEARGKGGPAWEALVLG